MESDMNIKGAIPPGSFSAHLFEGFKKEVEDAKFLLEYAVSQGFTTEDKRKVPDKVVDDIKAMEDLLRDADMTSQKFPGAEQRSFFEKAYRDLAELMSPVTAETLKFTSHDAKHIARWLWFKRSEAVIWSRQLAGITLLFVVAAIVGDLLLQVSNQFAPPIDETSGWFDKMRRYLLILIENTVPFTYGGIGACAYLLRSCHQYIIKRQFNKAYIPEYYNRILLGMISGGSIMMFVSQITTDQGEVLHLSSAAMGFLAGYNTDFLFSAVERIIQAILPKTGIETVRRAGPSVTAAVRTIEGLSIKEIMDSYQKATNDEDKKLYKSLLEKLRDKI
jgi:hypothetical protein